MSSIFFKLLLILANIIRGPLSVLLIILKNLIPVLNKRINFERLNLINDECRSFKKDNLLADYCFEVSSEGELEQVRPLIEYFLSENKRIEILFASPSVESKCLRLAQENLHSIRVLRLPIASLFPFDFLFFQSVWQWVSAPKIIFCRYDFFPELLAFKFLGKKLFLLSGATKRPTWFKKEAHLLFDLIVAANKTEEENFKRSNQLKKVFSFDFRIPRIFERIKKAQIVLNELGDMKGYFAFLETKERSEKIIMGSAWRSDLEILKSKPLANDLISGQVHLLIVPHNLRDESIQSIKSFLKENLPEVPVFEISKTTNLFSNTPGIVILNRSGILCELYTKFSFAYVGGGYERSIHSVLEPFLAGNQVFIGPRIHRSTEYDFLKELADKEIHLLNNPESFYNLFIEHAQYSNDLSIRQNLELRGHEQMKTIIREIELC